MAITNEYDTLKSVILGKCFDADVTEKLLKHKLQSKDVDAWKQIHEETNEDLQTIQNYLEQNGVTVYRPDTSYETIANLRKSYNYYGHISSPLFCRDWCFTYDDKMFLSNISDTHRSYEQHFYTDIINTLITTENDDHRKFVLSMPHSFNLQVSTDYNALQESSIRDQILTYAEMTIDDSIEPLKKQILSELKEAATFLLAEADKGFEEQANPLPFVLQSKNLYKNYYSYILDTNISNGYCANFGSYQKHGNIIMGTGVSTINASLWFRRLFTEPNYQHIEFRPRWFDWQNIYNGRQNNRAIVDIDLMVRGESWNDPEPLMRADSYWELTALIMRQYMSYYNITTSHEFESIESFLNLSVAKYISLLDYQGRRDWNLSTLTLSPRKIIGTFYDDDVRSTLANYNVETIHLPLRHGQYLGGGLYDCVIDLERESM